LKYKILIIVLILFIFSFIIYAEAFLHFNIGNVIKITNMHEYSNNIIMNRHIINGPVLNDLDKLGYSITNIGDLDGDGINDLVVGAYYDNYFQKNLGIIHIINSNTTQLIIH
jgi:hypothetical protein